MGATPSRISITILLAVSALAFLEWARDRPRTAPSEVPTLDAPAPGASVETSPAPAGLAPWDAIHRGVADAVGADDVQVADLAGDKAVVFWFIDDAITEGMVSDGARADAYRILRALANSGASFSSASLTGIFPLPDATGREWNRQVVKLEYDRSTIDRIDWASFRLANVYAAADSAEIHPRFR